MNEMIMVCHSVNNNTRTGHVISLCLDTNPLISLILPNRLKFTQLWYYSVNNRTIYCTAQDSCAG